MRIQDLIVAGAVCAGVGWFSTPQQKPPPVILSTPAAPISIRGVVVGMPAKDVLALLGEPLSSRILLAAGLVLTGTWVVGRRT